HMAMRPREKKRSLSKKVSSFNMYIDQVHQVQAIMEATGAVKDAPVIRELLDEALGARRRRALGITDAEEPPGQGTAETLHTIQTLLLKLIARGELTVRKHNIGLRVLQETLMEARASREVAFEELVEKPWIAKGKSTETMSNFFDMKTRYVREYVDGVIEKIKKEEGREYNQPKSS
ncbi:MAG: hypothetical protein M3Y84_12480, partial [Acidobacteriota bacterium]|nr:hypothetical protein [Acidobacteriota bacterium]